jgi:asparaginyl-tRNA synthetase
VKVCEKNDTELLFSLRHRYKILRQPHMKSMLRVQDEILSAIRDYLRGENFVEILAPIIGPATDPGIRGASQLSVDYYGTPFKVMSSMILYKQMAVSSLERIFAVSPNIRLEPVVSIATGRHLAEFRQVDLEQANATYYDVMSIAEQLIRYVSERISRVCAEEMKTCERSLKTPTLPFRRLTYEKALDILAGEGSKVKYGEEIPWKEEQALSTMFHEPFFIIDYPLTARGFYDREDPQRPGILRDFDLLYPEGFGEAISGGEREHTFRGVMKRMQMTGEDPAAYEWYLDMLKDGIPSSAGFGIGVERLTRWVCGLNAIWEAVPFPKVPGIPSS